MNKKEALSRLEKIEKESKELRKIIENDDITIDDVKNLSDICKILNIKEEELYLFSKNTKDPFEKYINACNIIPKIVKVYNETNIIDFTNDSQYKYLPYYKLNGLGWSFGGTFGWYSSASGSVSHYYISNENCKKACLIFNNIYIDYYSYKG